MAFTLLLNMKHQMRLSSVVGQPNLVHGSLKVLIYIRQYIIIVSTSIYALS